MSKSKYSGLFVKIDDINNWVKLWCEENLEGEFIIRESKEGNRVRYSIENQDKTILFDIIPCANGTITLFPKVGKEQDISVQIADSILERLSSISYNSPFSQGFSIIMPPNDFDTLVSIIGEIDGVKLLSQSSSLDDGKAKYILYQFRGSLGDKVTLRYFIKTQRMQMQGKPLLLYNDIIGIVSDGRKFDDVVSAQSYYCKVNVDPKEIRDEIDSVLPNVAPFLDEVHKSILSSAFVFSKIDVDLEDYSCLIFPALRVLEGYMKKLLVNKGIICNKTTTLGSLFDFDPTQGEFIVNSSTSQKIGCKKHDKVLKLAYNHYYKYRHGSGHAGASDIDTMIIQDRKTADSILNETLKIMDSTYFYLIS